jgi:hypothetical protein
MDVDLIRSLAMAPASNRGIEGILQVIWASFRDLVDTSERIAACSDSRYQGEAARILQTPKSRPVLHLFADDVRLNMFAEPWQRVLMYFTWRSMGEVLSFAWNRLLTRYCS